MKKLLFIFLFTLPLSAQFKSFDPFHRFNSNATSQERVFQEESLSLLARIDLEPTIARKEAIDDVIIALKAAGVWDELDILYIFPAHDLQAALLNWKEDEYNCTDSFDLVYYPEYGFEGEADKYLHTNFTPADDGFHFSITDASMGVVFKHPPYQGEGDPAYIAGTIDYTGLESWSFIEPVGSINEGDTFCATQLNGSPATNTLLPNTSYYAITVTYNESAGFIYVNAVSSDEIAATSTFLSGNELYILGGNDGGTPAYFYTGLVSCVFAGGYLTLTQHTVIYNAVVNYIQKFD